MSSSKTRPDAKSANPFGLKLLGIRVILRKFIGEFLKNCIQARRKNLNRCKGECLKIGELRPSKGSHPLYPSLRQFLYNLFREVVKVLISNSFIWFRAKLPRITRASVFLNRNKSQYVKANSSI
jgi:hypothetical protein